MFVNDRPVDQLGVRATVFIHRRQERAQAIHRNSDSKQLLPPTITVSRLLDQASLPRMLCAGSESAHWALLLIQPWENVVETRS